MMMDRILVIGREFRMKIIVGGTKVTGVVNEEVNAQIQLEGKEYGEVKSLKCLGSIITSTEEVIIGYI